MSPSRRRWRAALGLLAAGVAAVTALGALAGAAADLSADLALDGPTLDPALGLGACAAAGLVLTWLVAVTALALAAELTPARRLRGPAQRWAPAVVRRAVAVLLGTGLAAVGLTGPAAADDRPRAPVSPAGPALATWSADRPASVPTGDASHPDRTVLVDPGDTLWSIAARRLGHGASPAQITAEWHRWFAANRVAIGADPDLIRPGLRLRPPGD